MLDGIAPTPVAEPEPGLLARAFKPREKTFGWIPDYFERAYRHWGRLFFSPLTVTLLVMLSVAGVAVFAYLVGARYGTPLVVAHRLLIGGAVFFVGRFLIVMLHELAHGLALAHYGRRTSRAGIRLLFIFPYAFVDTSEAYFESRMHRIVISAAGPATDFSLGALFSIICAVSPQGQRARRVLPARLRRVRGRVLQRQPVPGPRRLPDPVASGCGSPSSRSARGRSSRRACRGR